MALESVVRLPLPVLLHHVFLVSLDVFFYLVITYLLRNLVFLRLLLRLFLLFFLLLRLFLLLSSLVFLLPFVLLLLLLL